MIKISLDEAYVFDMLSVLDVKLKKLSDEKLEVTKYKYNLLKQEILSQINEEKFFQIISSLEYQKMIEANQYVFDLVDLSKNDDGLAKITDNANFERHIAKMALQKRFFDSDLTEVKNRN